MRYKHPVRFPFHATQIDADIRDHQGCLMANFVVLGADLLSEFRHNGHVTNKVRYNVAGEDFVAFQLEGCEIDPASAYVLSVSVRTLFDKDSFGYKWFTPMFCARKVVNYK